MTSERIHNMSEKVSAVEANHLEFMKILEQHQRMTLTLAKQVGDLEDLVRRKEEKDSGETAFRKMVKNKELN